MIRFTPNMESAPRDRRILAMRADGDIGIVRWNEHNHHKKPNPYWSDERSWLGVVWCRENPPVAWAALQPAADEDVPCEQK